MNKKILIITLLYTLSIQPIEQTTTDLLPKNELGFFEHTFKTLAVFDVALRYVDQFRKDTKQKIFIPIFHPSDIVRIIKNPTQNVAEGKLRFIARQSKSISAAVYATIGAIAYNTFGLIGKEIDTNLKTHPPIKPNADETVSLVSAYSHLPFFTALGGAIHGLYHGCYPQVTPMTKITLCKCGNKWVENMTKNQKNYRGLDPNKQFWESMIVKSFDGFLGGLFLDELIHHGKKHLSKFE